MKRIFSVVLSGLFLAGFLACTKKEEPKPAEPPTIAPPAANQAPEAPAPQTGGEQQPGS